MTSGPSAHAKTRHARKGHTQVPDQRKGHTQGPDHSPYHLVAPGSALLQFAIIRVWRGQVERSLPALTLTRGRTMAPVTERCGARTHRRPSTRVPRGVARVKHALTPAGMHPCQHMRARTNAAGQGLGNSRARHQRGTEVPRFWYLQDNVGGGQEMPKEVRMRESIQASLPGDI